MKHNRIYKLNDQYISTPNSENGVFICETKDIIPTTEVGNMILFKVTNNTQTEFITALDASTALQAFLDIHKSVTLFATVICFVKDVKAI